LSNKISVRDSGLLQGFCDYHCHLLPSVDDGVEMMEDSLHILSLWESAGMREVWMTPHIMEDYPNKPDDLRQRFEKVKQAYNGSIALHLASENMMDTLFANRLEADELLPMGSGHDCLLVETSYYTPPINMKELFDRTKSKGYKPILAHPERYRYMNRLDYKYWRQEGVLLQLNVSSLTGDYGQEAKAKAEWLLRQGMYDLCGTDTHAIEQTDIFLNAPISKNTVKRLKAICHRI